MFDYHRKVIKSHTAAIAEKTDDPHKVRRLNTRFRVVFEPGRWSKYRHRRRFAIGAYSLHKYIGRKEAILALTGAIANLTDFYSYYSQKHGRIDFYYK